MMRNGLTKYALAFWTENHGWTFAGNSGTVTKDPTKAVYYHSMVEAVDAAHILDELQDQYHQVMPIQITYEWSWPVQKLTRSML